LSGNEVTLEILIGSADEEAGRVLKRTKTTVAAIARQETEIIIRRFLVERFLLSVGNLTSFANVDISLDTVVVSSVCSVVRGILLALTTTASSAVSGSKNNFEVTLVGEDEVNSFEYDSTLP
jgi:hypothetical protein